MLNKIITTSDQKILSKGDNVGLSFYAFFENKNNNTELLQSVATWWITDNKFDHFEKAIKIKKVVENLLTTI